MRAMFFALSADDVGELLPSVVEVIVNYSVFELAGVRQLLARVLHTALDDLLGILPAGAHAPLQLLDRRRQDEDADGVGIELAHLLRPLPVYFEDQVVAALQRIEDHLLRSAVAVAVHLGALEKLAAAAHGGPRPPQPRRVSGERRGARLPLRHFEEGDPRCAGAGRRPDPRN